MTDPIRPTGFPVYESLPIPSQISPFSPLNHHSTLSSNKQGDEGSFCENFIKKLLEVWRKVLSWFPCTKSQASSGVNSASPMDVMRDFGAHLITHALEENKVRNMGAFGCKVAILATLNGQEISRCLTRVTPETLPSVHRLAIQQFAHHLRQYAQNHNLTTSDEMKMEIYMSKFREADGYEIEYEFATQKEEVVHNHAVSLSKTEAVEYLQFRGDLIQFLILESPDG